MNKVLGILALVIVFSFQTYAQKSFQKGNVLFSPGVGLGSNYVSVGFTPSVFFAADFGVHDYVSVGPYIGTSFFSNATGFDFGARGNFHWWQLLNDKISKDLHANQLDIYTTFWLGGQILTGNTILNAGKFDAGFTQGVRWYPKANNRFALFGEFGWTPISYFTLGATIKAGK